MQGKYNPMRISSGHAALLGVLALYTALLTPGTSAAAVPATPMVPATTGAITYVCGGVGADEQQALQADARRYDMSLLFTQGQRGEYLSDVEVTVTHNGTEVASFQAQGPRCLIKAPKGKYQISATYLGVEKHVDLGSGQSKQLNW